MTADDQALAALYLQLIDYASAHWVALWLLSAGSVVMLVGSALAAPWLIARLPADYYLTGRSSPRSPLLARIGRSLLGAVLLLAGIVMLALPGQGLLTILVGLALLEFPGRRSLELRIAGVPALRRGLNWLRARGGAPPLLFDDSTDET